MSMDLAGALVLVESELLEFVGVGEVSLNSESCGAEPDRGFAGVHAFLDYCEGAGSDVVELASHGIGDFGAAPSINPRNTASTAAFDRSTQDGPIVRHEPPLDLLTLAPWGCRERQRTGCGSWQGG